ncbi:hypothetical protein V6N11_057590 [Hibiscus sabdariffa]|uniref:Uncharacterized protein n=1 Tax=Hibiscus sabdariffa TaxID=183260 RepID=A0ABR2NHT0_9ROSI
MYTIELAAGTIVSPGLLSVVSRAVGSSRLCGFPCFWGIVENADFRRTEEKLVGLQADCTTIADHFSNPISYSIDLIEIIVYKSQQQYRKNEHDMFIEAKSHYKASNSTEKSPSLDEILTLASGFLKMLRINL